MSLRRWLRRWFGEPTASVRDSPRARHNGDRTFTLDPEGSYVVLYDPRPICGCDGEHCGDGPVCQYVARLPFRDTGSGDRDAGVDALVSEERR